MFQEHEKHAVMFYPKRRGDKAFHLALQPLRHFDMRA
ncbi:hypothetical protein U716_05470 [Rhodobacter capsulatus B6]|nr:hypothetical protein U716_05470 [Rhodobacter capsulatus B6]